LNSLARITLNSPRLNEVEKDSFATTLEIKPKGQIFGEAAVKEVPDLIQKH